MPAHDFVVGHALGARELDVIAVELIDHVAADPHRVVGRRAERHADERQDVAQRLFGVEEHRQGRRCRHRDLDEQIVDDRRHGVDEDDVARAELVPEAVLFSGHEHAQRAAQHQRDADGAQAEAHGIRHLLAEDLGHRGLGLQRHGAAEVEMNQIVIEVEQLLIPRVEQAHVFENLLFVFLVHRVRAAAEVSLHRHQAHQQEHDRNDDEHGDDGRADAL